MSLQLNLSNPEIREAYNEVLNGDPSTNWVLYTYEGASNDLKVQDTGSGGLEELEDSFNDGRIQYAFVRVKDLNTGLPKFVQVNWCGDGVPVARKGLFASHSATVTAFLKYAHVQISARNSGDVDPDNIMKKVRDASGSNYSVHNELPTRADPIAPTASSYKPVGKVDISELRRGARPDEPIAPVVGSGYKPVGKVDITELRRGGRPDEPIAPVSGGGYKPVGKVDIAELRRGAQADVIEKVGTTYTPPREELASLRSGGLNAPPPPPSAPRPSASPAVSAAAPPPPAAPRPTPATPPTSRPTVGGFNPRPAVPAAPAPITPSAPPKPAEEDRIGPVGTAYTPVSLPAPRKLVNPFAKMQQESEPQPTLTPSHSGKKLTWSERQAAAKKLQDEEDHSTHAAAAAASTPATRVLDTAAAGVGAAVGAVAGAAAAVREAVGEAMSQPPPPPPTAPRPPMAARPSDVSEPEEEGWPEEPETSRPVPPPPPMAPRPPARAPEPEPEPEAAPPPPPPPPPPPLMNAEPVAAVANKLAGTHLDEPPVPGPKAVVQFPYEAAEENEIDLVEGETIYGIEQLDEGWWSGTNSSGKHGLFPSNYVEMVEEEPDHVTAAAAPPPPPPPAAPRPTEPTTPHAIAVFDYDAAEDNEITFKEGQAIIDIEFVSDDWWQGRVEGGEPGLFPSNYVELQQ